MELPMETQVKYNGLQTGISAGLSALDSAVNLGFNIYDRIYADKWNKKQFEYNKSMNDLMMQREDTSIQRRMNDLKNAGLNPLLAVSGMGSASSSAGSTRSSVDTSLPSYKSNLAGVLDALMSRKTEQLQQELIMSQIEQNNANTYFAVASAEERLNGIRLLNESRESRNTLSVDEHKKNAFKLEQLQHDSQLLKYFPYSPSNNLGYKQPLMSDLSNSAGSALSYLGQTGKVMLDNMKEYSKDKKLHRKIWLDSVKQKFKNMKPSTRLERRGE